MVFAFLQTLSSATRVVFFRFSATAVTIAIFAVRVQCIGEELTEGEIELSEDIAGVVMAICGCAVFIGDTIAVRLYEELDGAFKTYNGEHSYCYEKSVIADSVNKRCSEFFYHIVGD